MNKQRRKSISDLSSAIETTMNSLSAEDPEISWPDTKTCVNDFHSQSESIRDDEQDYLDNMPESFKNGDKGEAAQNAVDALEIAMDKLEEAETACADEAPDVDEVVGVLQEAIDALGDAESV